MERYSGKTVCLWIQSAFKVCEAKDPRAGEAFASRHSAFNSSCQPISALNTVKLSSSLSMPACIVPTLHRSVLELHKRAVFSADILQYVFSPPPSQDLVHHSLFSSVADMCRLNILRYFSGVH